MSRRQIWITCLKLVDVSQYMPAVIDHSNETLIAAKNGSHDFLIQVQKSVKLTIGHFFEVFC